MVLVGGIFYVGVSNSRYLSQIVGNLFDGLDVGVINIVVVLIYEGNSGQTLLLPWLHKLTIDRHELIVLFPSFFPVLISRIRFLLLFQKSFPVRWNWDLLLFFLVLLFLLFFDFDNRLLFIFDWFNFWVFLLWLLFNFCLALLRLYFFVWFGIFLDSFQNFGISLNFLCGIGGLVG